MPPIPHVLPGEVIRASLINQLIDAANAGTGPAPIGVPVPDLFGRTLDQARLLLTQPSTNLALGSALDVFGAVVDPSAPGSGSRFVLNQSPSTGTHVPIGSPVNVVVAALSTVPPPPPPAITRTETVTGTVTSSFRVGESLVIVGSGFNIAAGLNTVTIGGQPVATVQPDPANPTQRLIVAVPTGIPGAPVNPTDPPLPNVQVAVRNQGSTPGTFTITVLPPSGVPLPDIIDFSPSQQFVGSNVTIGGANFSSVLARNIVTLASTPPTAAVLVSATTDQIVFTVPNLPGLGATSGSTLSVNIIVTVNDASSNPIGSDVSDTPLIARRP
jgi:hypothetical protein